MLFLIFTYNLKLKVMTVYELNIDELGELVSTNEEIGTREEIIKHYEGTSFVKEDFFFNL